MDEKNRTGWLWVPTLFFTESIIFIIITSVSVILYQKLDINNSEIILYTSLLYLPWLLKPFWSPIVDVIGTKKSWILFTEFSIAIGFLLITFLIQFPDSFQFTLIAFWIIAFIASLHDVAADAFYMLALKESKQSFFIGLRNSFYKFGIVATTTTVLLIANQSEKIFSVAPAEFKVVANPKKFFEETIKIDSFKVKENDGNIKLISRPSYLEISTKPKTKDQVNFYVNFARNLNIMNGFNFKTIYNEDSSNTDELTGNIGIIKLFLSKKPSEKSEFIIKPNFVEGENKFKIIEGNSLRFTSLNWNKPAFVVIQVDSNVTSKISATFKAEVDKNTLSWSVTFGALSIFIFLLFIYHKFILPELSKDQSVVLKKSTAIGKEFFRSFARYFEKKKIIISILFILFYLFGKYQISKMMPLFLSDEIQNGGLKFLNYDVKLIKGIIAPFFFALGSILSGFIIYKKGLKTVKLPIMLLMNVTLIVYIYLSWFQQTNFWIVSSLVAIDNFSLGLGFSFIMMFMIYISDGDYRASHFAISFGFLSLGILLSEMSSTIINQALGYKFFFVWVIISTLPSFLLSKFVNIEYGFGKRKNLVN